MQLYDDFFNYLDTHRYCLLFCDPNHKFDNIYDTFRIHEQYFPVYKVVLYVIGGITDVFLVLTVFILLRYGRNLNNSYRNIMVFNTFLPAIFTNYICFLWQPYAIAPHFVLYTIGPIRWSFYSTGILILTFVSLSIHITYSLFSQLSYHAFIIMSPQNTLKMFWINVAWNVTAFCAIVFNMIFIFLALDRQHFRLESRILSEDPRFEYMISNYAPYVVDMNTATIPMNVLILEAIYAIVIFTLGIIYFAIRILRSFLRNRTLLSERITRVQKNIILTLIAYTATYLGLLGFPSIAAAAAMLFRASADSFPLAALYFICASTPAVLFCVINLVTVSPYRRAIRSFFSRCLPSLAGSANASTATVSDNRNAVIVANSLFTRQPQPERSLTE